MASNAYAWTERNPGGLIIGLVGADHVKFVGGITGRYTQMMAATTAKGGSPPKHNIAILLNPTLIDTRPSGSVSNILNSDSSSYPDKLTLQLRYVKEGVDANSVEAVIAPQNTGGVLPLSDYIIVSS